MKCPCCGNEDRNMMHNVTVVGDGRAEKFVFDNIGSHEVFACAKCGALFHPVKGWDDHKLGDPPEKKTQNPGPVVKDQAFYRERIKDLEEAAKPMIDFLYKYGCPYSTVIVSMSEIAFSELECGIPVEPRD